MNLPVTIATLCALFPGAAGVALSQTFPSKPIRIIVSTSPGGLTDLISRNSGQSVTESTGQPVVVEYRPGAGTLIGFQACAKAPPDGYTVCVTTPESIVYNPLLYAKLPYDPENDFVAVTNLATGVGGVIVAHPSTPGNNFAEMIAHAKANPGALNYATWGSGSVPGIFLGWINYANGVSITPVPYKGAGPSLPAIVAGQVHLTYSAIGLVAPHVKAGKLKLLAVAGTKRGSHLALSLERLEHLAGRPVQRIALSATVSPLDEVARFASGDRPCTIVDAGMRRAIDVDN